MTNPDRKLPVVSNQPDDSDDDVDVIVEIVLMDLVWPSEVYVAPTIADWHPDESEPIH